MARALNVGNSGVSLLEAIPHRFLQRLEQRSGRGVKDPSASVVRTCNGPEHGGQITLIMGWRRHLCTEGG
jgi:hypothetical protein